MSRHQGGARPTEIRDNLEYLTKDDGIEYSSTKITIQENIKEAESMIFELKYVLYFLENNVSRRFVEHTKEYLSLKKKLKDWQNLLNWLRSLK